MRPVGRGGEIAVYLSQLLIKGVAEMSEGVVYIYNRFPDHEEASYDTAGCNFPISSSSIFNNKTKDTTIDGAS